MDLPAHLRSLFIKMIIHKKTKNINISNIKKYFVHVSIFRFVLVDMFFVLIYCNFKSDLYFVFFKLMT